MYQLNDDELKKYRTNYLFRNACEIAFRNELTKEQMLSGLLIRMLNKQESDEQEKLEAMIYSTKPHSIILD